MTFLPGLCAAVASAVTAGAPQSSDAPARIRWSNPNIFSAVPRGEKDIYVSPAFRYGEYSGRKAEFKEFNIGGYVTDTVEVWYSKLDVLMKGRTVARFRSDADTYGARWYFQPKTEGKMAMAAEFETMTSSDGVASAPGSRAVFKGPESWTLRLIGSNAKADFLVGYTNAKVGNSLKSNVFELGVGQDSVISDRWMLRLQGSLIAENIDREFEGVDLEIKPVLFGAVSYRLTNSSRLEFDGTIMPTGVPIAYGRDTGFTAFQLHNLTGPAAGIRNDPFALLSIRLNYSIRY